mgnify:FL=1
MYWNTAKLSLEGKHIVASILSFHVVHFIGLVVVAFGSITSVKAYQEFPFKI